MGMAKQSHWLVVMILLGSLLPGAAYAIDHLAIRGLDAGSVIYQNDTTTYYFTRTERGSPIIVAIHDVDFDQPVIERVFVENTDEASKGVWQVFVYGRRDLDLFNTHLLPHVRQQSPNSERIGILHYNARVLLEGTFHNSTIEQPVVSTGYRPPKQRLGEPEGEWLYSYTNRVGGREVERYDARTDTHLNVTLNDALQSRAIRADNLLDVHQGVQSAERQQRQDAEQAQQRLLAAAAADRQAGIVYKSENFWNEFNNFEPARAAFEGSFAGLRESPAFKSYFIDFVGTYSLQCASFLPAGSVERTYLSRKTTYDQYGVVHSRGPWSEFVIRIDPDYQVKYDQFTREVSAYNAVNTGVTLLEMTIKMAEAFNKPARDFSENMQGVAATALSDFTLLEMLRFFAKANGCSSATLYQMKENIYRAAHGKPSLQAANVVVENAAAESDSIEEMVSARSFHDACLEYHDRDGYKTSWCRCLDTEARKVMTGEELKHFSDNFASYYIDVDRAQKGADDPRWRLQRPLNACRK